MNAATDGSLLAARTEIVTKASLGQVFTPLPIAQLMAGMLECRQPQVSLLDAGAGIGSLTMAVTEALCARLPALRPQQLHVTAYELDYELIGSLHETLQACRACCLEAGIGFDAEVICRDFLEAASEQLAGGLFAVSKVQKFNCVVMNPPYRKIQSGSKFRHWLRRIGVETSNLYTGFLAAAIRLMEPEGEIVAITPRSFCNGPYFQSFRRELLSSVALDRLHLFESRKDTFREAEVLQETLVFHAVKDAPNPAFVFVSGSESVSGRAIPFYEVVKPGDPNAFIHIVPKAEQQSASKRISGLSSSLNDLGLSVSTGRVVDFRVRAFLRTAPEAGTVPLLYPGHLADSRVLWPQAKDRRQSAKPGNILAVRETEALLVPNANYVLLRRFSTKEEKKRLVATVFEAGCVPGDRVGFENHLNYFHNKGSGLDLDLARGLAAFLNSTLADDYFRQFNGHTQVNATDLRAFRYPGAEQLLLMGEQLGTSAWKQQQIDDLLELETDARAH